MIAFMLQLHKKEDSWVTTHQAELARCAPGLIINPEGDTWSRQTKCFLVNQSARRVVSISDKSHVVSVLWDTRGTRVFPQLVSPYWSIVRLRSLHGEIRSLHDRNVLKQLSHLILMTLFLEQQSYHSLVMLSQAKIFQLILFPSSRYEKFYN